MSGFAARAGQIGGIAVVLRPGVKQEAAHLGGRAVIEFGVVQHGGVFIERHNIAVGNVDIAMAGGRQVGEVDIELAHAGHKGLARRLMAVDRHLLRFAHTGQLVISLV